MDGHQNRSYILCDNDNYYRPGESLKTLFENEVVQPFKNHPLTQAWVSQVKDKDLEYHTKEILRRGSSNFDESFNGLTPKDKVLLYCLYYMPMHLFSSYHVFTRHLTQVSNKVVFIDFGCGPLTSGIAFWAACTGHRDITYLGIDSSQTMRDKAMEINRYGSFFTKFGRGADFNGLLEALESKYIVDGDQTQIIFNFCYSLARHTLDTEKLSVADLSNSVIQIVEKYSQHKMLVIYQNPRIPTGHSLQSSYFHENWYSLKAQLSAFQSQVTGENTNNFSYDSLADGSYISRDFYYDILSNQPSDYSNNPY